jgi:hypothetical protein
MASGEGLSMETKHEDASTGITLVSGCPDRQECMGCDVELMRVPRCETCRWWDHDPAVVGQVHGGAEGLCRKLTQMQSTRIDSIAEEVCVPRDFGCVQWEGGDE